MNTLRKVARILGIVLLALIVIFFTAYFIVNEEEPKGITGSEADALAQKMMASVNKEAWDSTKWVKWTFYGMHDFVWDKERDLVEVRWDDYKVLLHTKTGNSMAYLNEKLLEGEEAEKATQEASLYFNNDSFWLNAVVKAFDPGTERSIVELKDGQQGLKVKYHSGGDTPGDAYLWHLDENFRPTAYQMWVQIIPIGGVKATWEGWQTLSTGAVVATKHQMMGNEMELVSNVAGGMTLDDIGRKKDPFREFEL